MDERVRGERVDFVWFDDLFKVRIEDTPYTVISTPYRMEPSMFDILAEKRDALLRSHGRRMEREILFGPTEYREVPESREVFTEVRRMSLDDARFDYRFAYRVGYVTWTKAAAEDGRDPADQAFDMARKKVGRGGALHVEPMLHVEPSLEGWRYTFYPDE